MSKHFAKLAKIERQRVVCPYCGSANTCYAEDRTVMHVIRYPPVVPGDTEADLVLIVDDDDGLMMELADRERILCRDCTESSGIPAMCELIFE